MAKRNRPLPPRRPSPAQGGRLELLELGRFTEASVAKWNSVSRYLDELNDVLYFGIEPDWRRLRSELIAALQGIPLTTVALLPEWVRFVTYQFSTNPLSCAGSLQDIGGRFNAGVELEAKTLSPWPALYLAQDYETGFREKFQLPSDTLVEGLTPQDLALSQGINHAVVSVNGRLSRVFDMTDPKSLEPVARVFGKIKLPERARQLMKQLGIPIHNGTMIKTGKQLHDHVLKHNWRALPIQFGLPAQSQTIAELVRAAGFEAILYKSTKGPGQCLAIFPDLLGDDSFVELAGTPPPGVTHRRLDSESAADLSGWESVSPRLRLK